MDYFYKTFDNGFICDIIIYLYSGTSWKHIWNPLIWALYLCNKHTVLVAIDRKYRWQKNNDFNLFQNLHFARNYN